MNDLLYVFINACENRWMKPKLLNLTLLGPW
jgi:hypothetical protein